MYFDAAGKEVISIDGRYLVTTTANVIYFSDDRKLRMSPVINKSSGGAERCFIIEGQGYLLASSFNDCYPVGQFDRFYVKLIA